MNGNFQKTKYVLGIGSTLILIALTISTVKTVKAAHLISNDLGASIGASVANSLKTQINDSSGTDATSSTNNTFDSSNSSTTDASLSEEAITSSDLGVSDPTLLPDSHFYFLKNWWRGIRLFFTFNPIKKIELENKFANEKLIEAKKLAQKTKNSAIIDKAIKNYEESVNKIKKQTEKIKERKINSQEVNKFLNKFTRQQILHQEILDRLEKKVPPAAFQKIREAREKHLEMFKDVMTKLESGRQIPQRIEKAVERIHKIHFPGVVALRMIKKIEDKIKPMSVKKDLSQAEEKILQHLQKKIRNTNPRQKRIFERTIKNGGDKYSALQIIERLKGESMPTSTRHFLNRVQSKVMQEFIREKNERIQRTEKKFIPVKIKDILENPEKWINKKVKINGRIILPQGKIAKELSKTMPRIARVDYYLDDGTGRISAIGHLPRIIKSSASNSGQGQNLTVFGEVKNNGLIRANSKIKNKFKPYLVIFRIQQNGQDNQLLLKHQPPAVKTRSHLKRLRSLVRPIEIHQNKCKNLCGDGICQKVVCLSTNCPCAETPENCPQDCHNATTTLNNNANNATSVRARAKQRYENFLHRHLRMPNEQK